MVDWGVVGRGGRGRLSRPFFASPLRFGLTRKWLWWGRGAFACCVRETGVCCWFGAAVGVCHEALLRCATALGLSLPQPRYRLMASGAGGAGTLSVPFSRPQQCSVRPNSPVVCAPSLYRQTQSPMMAVLVVCRISRKRAAGPSSSEVLPRPFGGSTPINRSFDDVSQAVPVTSK